MTIDQFLQGPSVYIPVILFNLIITLSAYGAFPFIFAKARKSPITKKKYRLLCFAINFIVMVAFIAIRGEASNGGAYLLWTWVFSRYGAKMLDDDDLLADNISVTTKEGPSPSTTNKPYDRPDDLLLQPEPQPEPQPIIVTTQKAKKPIKVKYCSKCGSLIDNTSKKCTGCGKQYFKGIRINIPIFILVAIIIVLCILTFHTTNENKTLLQQIADKDYKITQLSANIKDLKSEVDALYIQNGELQQQLEEAAEIHELELRRETFVLCDKETNMYHEIYRGSDCAFEYHARVIIEVEGKYSDTYPGQYFYIRLEDAIDFGFTKCPECK